MIWIHVIEEYKSALQAYSAEQLRYKCEEDVWSIGQMYDHLIIVAHEYLDELETCASAKVEQANGKTEFGEKLFKNGGFPPIKIRLPGEMNEPPNNTGSKEELTARLEQLTERMRQSEVKAAAANPRCKTEHGGFGWLNAKEWYDLVGMHFEHHRRQKAALDEVLGL